MRLFWIVAISLCSLVACGSHPPSITISQPLVMGSEVLSAGITADAPVINGDEAPAATTTVYNDRDVPVTIHYRYYWYDAQGLEVNHSGLTQSVAVPARGSSLLPSSSGSLSARQVRIYIYL